LLAPEPAESATLAQALKELPRMLDKARRRTGTFRPLEAAAPLEKAAEVASAPSHAPGENGVSTHALKD
jgi:hypothetical protein